MSDNTTALLAERELAYGSFDINAQTAQRIKNAIRLSEGFNKLTPSKKEALEMISLKIARVLNGDQNYLDSWVDIAGYATLIVEEIRRKLPNTNG